MDRWVGFLGVLGALGGLVGLVALLARRWKALPGAPQPPALEWDVPRPPSPPKPGDPGRCRYCLRDATRVEPTIIEHRSAWDAVASFLPIGLVVVRLRRAASWVLEPDVCELHGSIAERAIDAHLAESDATLARALQQRSTKAHTFVSVDLPALLRSTTPGS